jgi:hypothetical protein
MEKKKKVLENYFLFFPFPFVCQFRYNFLISSLLMPNSCWYLAVCSFVIFDPFAPTANQKRLRLMIVDPTTMLCSPQCSRVLHREATSTQPLKVYFLFVLFERVQAKRRLPATTKITNKLAATRTPSAATSSTVTVVDCPDSFPALVEVSAADVVVEVAVVVAAAVETVAVVAASVVETTTAGVVVLGAEVGGGVGRSIVLGSRRVMLRILSIGADCAAAQSWS